VDGQPIFSKHDIGRFPEPDEVEERFALFKQGKELPPLSSASGRGTFLRGLMSKLRG
jgi:hypothetical protein